MCRGQAGKRRLDDGPESGKNRRQQGGRLDLPSSYHFGYSVSR